MRTMNLAWLCAAALLMCSTAIARSPLLPDPVTSGRCFETFSFQFYDVYYINGIRADRQSANDNLEEIEGLLDELYSDYIDVCDDPGEETFAFKLQYSRSNGFIEDVVEAIRQRLNSGRLEAYRRLSSFFNGAAAFVTGQPAPDENDARDLALLVLARGPDVDDIARFANEYEATLASGPGRRRFFSRCPMVVGYSQGNLFANRAFELVNDPYCLSVVSIGSPDSVVRGFAGDHARLLDDVVIQQASEATGNALPINVDNPGFNLFTLNHSLAEDYLKSGSNSRTRISDAIDKFTFCDMRIDTSPRPQCPQ